MKLTFLGTGSAFCVSNYQSNILLEHDDKRLLLDCGTDIRWSLKAQGLTPLDLDAIYVSHLHADHIGGMECVGFLNFFIKKFRPLLFGQKQVLEDLWNHSLSGGLHSIQGVDATLDTYFDTHRIAANGSFDYAGITYKLIQTVHGYSGRALMSSYGLMFDVPSGSQKPTRLLITTDTQYATHQMLDFIAMSDLVFHDCEIGPYASGVHAHYNELLDLPDALKAKVWLYHYGDHPLPDAVADGFAGFVLKGQEFEI